jgi:hypothetical protein
MTGSFISGCILFPLALLALSVGGGLLVRRVGGGWLPTGLIVPVGFALVVVTCSFATYFSWLAPAAGYIALVFALTGFACEARASGLRLPRLHGIPWAALAALAAFAAVGAPTLLTGTPTWTGYARIVDIGFQLDFAQHLADAGRSAVGNDSSYHTDVQKLVGIGYPGGAQATLGCVAALIHTNIAWCYQMYHAFTVAVGALAVFSLLGKVTRNGPLRAVAATAAIQPNLLYAYTLEGGIKEVTTASLLVLVYALLAERLPGAGRAAFRSVIPAAVAIAAAVVTFSFGVAPWLGVLLLGAFVASLLKGPWLRTFGSWLTLGVLAILMSLPADLSAFSKLGGIAKDAIGGTVDLGLGNLAAPVPDWSAAGVWLTGDYRFPLLNVTMTHRLDVFVIVFAILGVALALVRRRWILAIMGIAAPIALVYYVEHSTAWLQFKSFTITGVFALTLAFVGAAGIQRSRRRVVSLFGWAVAAVITGGVAYGNALIYHDTTLAPAARYHELAAIDKRYAGQGPALFPGFDEYAEYFLRDVQATSSVDPAHGDFELASGVSEPGGIGYAFTLNQFRLSYLQKFKLVVEPRNPTGVRAPTNWDLVQQTKYFNVWRRDRPAADVYAHLPLSGLPHERSALYCQRFLAQVRHAGAGARIAYVTVETPATEVLPTTGVHSSYWRAEGSSLVALGAGSDRVGFTLPRAGRFNVWIAGTIGRPVKFLVDGRLIGTVAYEERYPGQFLHIGTRWLAAGPHTLLIERGGGSLHPGSGDDVDSGTRDLGPIVFSAEEPTVPRVRVAPASAAARICAAPVGYQWIEVLRAGSALTSNAIVAKS